MNMKTEMLKMNIAKVLLLFAAMAATVLAKGDLTLLSPVGGEVFSTLTDGQLKAFSGATRQERFEILKGADKKATSKEWRRQRPLVLEWRSTGGDKYPWRVRLATKPDMGDARDFWIAKDDVQRKKSPDGKESVWKYEVPLANLELGKTYYWQVWSCVKCSTYSCGFTYPEKCACGKSKHGTVSSVASFKTASEPPRWIELEGRVKNVRDLGGWRTADGRKVRTGLVYRGQGLNDNSLVEIGYGRNRLMVEDVAYMTKTLGVKTDLDLRSDREIAGMTQSPLGAGVNFIHHSSLEYGGIFASPGRETMAANFRVFCDRANYPVYFHCIAGADRTGTLAYVLNGLLGVAKEDLERDWESTFYPEVPGVEDPGSWRSLAPLDKGFANYGAEGERLQRRIELYLLDIGITPDEIATFKSIMLDEDK